MKWKDVMHFATYGSPEPNRQVIRTEEEWKKDLSPEQFQITRRKGTEAPYSGELCESYEEGKYACVCCHEILFDSTIKYSSKSGWPSFTEPVKVNVIRYDKDNSFGMARVEVLCNVCDAHLGHVFPDGPEPTGLRYCINSVSLELIRDKE